MNQRSVELEIDGAVNRARLRGEGTEALSAARVFVLAYAESLTWGLERISHALNVRGRGETVDVVFRLREGEVGCVVVEYRLTVCGVALDERVLAHDPGGLSGVEHRAARCASHDLDLVARWAGVADVFPGPELSDLDPGAEGVEVACPAGPERRLRDGFGSLDGCAEAVLASVGAEVRARFARAEGAGGPFAWLEADAETCGVWHPAQKGAGAHEDGVLLRIYESVPPRGGVGSREVRMVWWRFHAGSETGDRGGFIGRVRREVAAFLDGRYGAADARETSVDGPDGETEKEYYIRDDSDEAD